MRRDLVVFGREGLRGAAIEWSCGLFRGGI
jgi:hypothetical protein